jgi:CheY-like chemotaxis protein
MFPGSVLSLRTPAPDRSPPLQLHDRGGILLAESDEESARVFVVGLRSAGHAVDLARSGREVLPLAELYRPALLILDLDMPDLDVFTCTRQIKRTPGLQGTLVLALIAHNQPGDQVLAQHAGCDRLLLKPLRPEQLVAEVEEALNRWRRAPPLSRLPGSAKPSANHSST